jgi:hypothetical protein
MQNIKRTPSQSAAALLLAAVAANTALRATPATAFVDEIFVTNPGREPGNGTISAYNSLGGTVNASLVTGLSDPAHLAVSGSILAVIDVSVDSVAEYTWLGATVTPRFFFEGLQSPYTIAASGSNLFVTTGPTTIGEFTASGATINSSLITGLSNPDGIAISGSNLFVTNESNGTVGEYTTSGATVNASLITGLNDPHDIAVSGSNLFITMGTATIGEYTTSGTTVNSSLITGLNQPQDLVVSGSSLFVANFNAGSIGEYTTSGATVNASLFTGLNGPDGVAVAHVIPGDVNYDGTVNGQDIALLASHWLQSGDAKSLQGDANYNGIVNGQDIAVIASNWLQTAGGGAGGGASVPEPSTLILAVLGVLALLACQRQLASRTAP